MKQPFISILVPVYNATKYLKLCLDSIASQTYRNWEAIIVDDASKDDSLSICRQFADVDSRFRILPQPENGGVMKARLRALKEAAGDYIVWVDADDIIGPDRLTLMVEQIERHDVDVVITGYTRFVEKSGKKTAVFDSLAPGLYDKERWAEEKKAILAFDQKKGNRRLSPNLWSKCWRKGLFLNHLDELPHGLELGEDALMSYSAMLHAFAVSVLEDYSYIYRIAPGQTTSFRYYKSYYGNALSIYNLLRKWGASDLAADENIVHVSAFAVMNEGLNKNKADRKYNIRLIVGNPDTQSAIYKESMAAQNCFYRMTARAIKAKAYGRLNFIAGTYRLFTRIASHF